MSESLTGKRDYVQIFRGVVLLLAIAVYVGSYFWIVDRTLLPKPWSDHRAARPNRIGEHLVPQNPHYASNPDVDRALDTLFGPLHHIDRNIRETYWADVDVNAKPL